MRVLALLAMLALLGCGVKGEPVRPSDAPEDAEGTLY